MKKLHHWAKLKIPVNSRDPIRFFNTHYPNHTRSRLSREDPGFYRYLLRFDLLTLYFVSDKRNLRGLINDLDFRLVPYLSRHNLLEDLIPEYDLRSYGLGKANLGRRPYRVRNSAAISAAS